MEGRKQERGGGGSSRSSPSWSSAEAVRSLPPLTMPFARPLPPPGHVTLTSRVTLTLAIAARGPALHLSVSSVHVHIPLTFFALLTSAMSAAKYANLPDIVRTHYLFSESRLITQAGYGARCL